jgi:hypothetical protein
VWRIVGLTVVVLLVVAVVVVSRLNSATPEQAATEVPSTSPSSAPSSALSATELPAQSARSTAGALPSLIGPPLPQTGPGVTEPGILLIAAPAADGSFDVFERVRPASPVSVVTLRPAPVDQAGGQFGSASAAATQVQLSAGDQSVVVPGATVDAAVELPVAAVDQFELRYRLGGVTVRSTPSAAGRALAAIGPLTGGVDEDLPVLIVVSGDSVLGLNCPLLPFSEQACGNRLPTGAGFEHELPWRLALASVQFNVPGA